jgi:hypothetical protein
MKTSFSYETRPDQYVAFFASMNYSKSEEGSVSRATYLHTYIEKSERYMKEPEQGKQRAESVNVPIEWHIPDDIQSRYASNVFVQPGEYEIILSFFETQPPILTGSPEENLAKLRSLSAIQARCVGRIVIDPELVPKLIQALQNGLDGYLATKKEMEGDDSR